jgi:hypothetical protein
MIQWRIYYDDGSTFSNGDGEPEDAPGMGVVFIVCASDAYGRRIMCGWDFYYYRPDAPDVKWWGCNTIGLIDNLANKPRQTLAVKVGRTVSDFEYQTLKRQAEQDPDFNPQSSPNGMSTPTATRGS